MSLTRGGVILVVLLLAVLGIATPGNAAVFIVLSSLTALLVLNLPYAALAVRGVTVRREHPTHTKEGVALRVRLHVTNRSRAARILLRLTDTGPGGPQPEPVQVPVLPGRARETVTYTCNAGRRGVYRFDTCRVESCSPFGLLNARRRVPAKSELVVYPLYYELTGGAFPFRKSYSGLTAAPGSRPGEGPCFFGLREYRPGDRIRRIHWPSTLRTRTVMVREFEEDMHSAVTILLDNQRRAISGAGADTNLEAAVRVAATLANHLLVNGHPTSLMYFDQATNYLRIDKATGALTPILDGLARLEPSALPPADLISIGRSSADKHSNWIVVLLSTNRAAMTELLRIRAQGVELALIVVDEHGHELNARDREWLPGMLELFEEAGIRTILMRPDADIQGVLSKTLQPVRRVRL